MSAGVGILYARVGENARVLPTGTVRLLIARQQGRAIDDGTVDRTTVNVLVDAQRPANCYP